MLKPTVFRPSERPDARDITRRQVVPNDENASTSTIELKDSTTAPAGAVVISPKVRREHRPLVAV